MERLGGRKKLKKEKLYRKERQTEKEKKEAIYDFFFVKK